MAGIFNSAVFNSSVFNTGGTAADTVGHSKYVHWQTARDIAERERDLERERIKKEEIARLRIEAQEALLRKQELASAKDKQTKRQLAAIESEYAALVAELEAQMQALRKIEKTNALKRQVLLRLMLVAACPFSTIH